MGVSGPAPADGGDPYHYTCMPLPPACNSAGSCLCVVPYANDAGSIPPNNVCTQGVVPYTFYDCKDVAAGQVLVRCNGP